MLCHLDARVTMAYLGGVADSVAARGDSHDDILGDAEGGPAAGEPDPEGPRRADAFAVAFSAELGTGSAAAAATHCAAFSQGLAAAAGGTSGGDVGDRRRGLAAQDAREAQAEEVTVPETPPPGA